MLKKLFIFFVIILFLTVVSLLLLKMRSGGGYSTPFLSSVKGSAAQSCDYTSAVEYLYYEDSEWKQNNKVGLYIYAENSDYFELAQQLVNSNGGDWGYVLIPFNVKDKDFDKWNRVFEQLRNKHLIPIIQLWDIDTDKYQDQTKDAAKFLDGFVWPIKERYISAYNEMNAADFWYGYINPEEYAQILDYTLLTFKDIDPNFFVMNGAFNVSATTDAKHLDAFEYMRQMDKAIPGIFNRLDGWASHSYPQPNFSGKPTATGRTSIRAYETELAFLRNELGVDKELPVFITETGWTHAEGDSYNTSFYNVDTIAEFFEIAFIEVWLRDDRVRAVTPFTIKYDAPFDHFSWINNDKVPYAHYERVKGLKKLAGDPPSIKVGTIGVECDNNK